MIKLTKEEASFLEYKEGVGFYCEYGAVIGDDKFVLVKDNKDSFFLAHISEFDTNGLFVKLKGENNVV